MSKTRENFMINFNGIIHKCHYCYKRFMLLTEICHQGRNQLTDRHEPLYCPFCKKKMK